jgi:transcriptional regulator
MTSPFVPSESADVARLVDAYPLCWVLSGGAQDRLATPLPLLAETDEAGAAQSLFGHMAKGNPHCAALERDGRATILAMGPQGYISPRLVSNPTWGPTWNYAVCRFEVDVRFVPDETDAALSKLAAALEGNDPDAWTPDHMGDRYDQLKPRIIAFRAHVREAHARFKLGQDESEVVFGDIVGGLADRILAEWMIRARG